MRACTQRVNISFLEIKDNEMLSRCNNFIERLEWRAEWKLRIVGIWKLQKRASTSIPMNFFSFSYQTTSFVLLFFNVHSLCSSDRFVTRCFFTQSVNYLSRQLKVRTVRHSRTCLCVWPVVRRCISDCLRRYPGHYVVNCPCFNWQATVFSF